MSGIISHHIDPVTSFDQWDRSQLTLPENAVLSAADFIIWDDPREVARIRSRVDIAPVDLSEEEIAALVGFLHALTDRDALLGRLGKPDRVPSNLEID